MPHLLYECSEEIKSQLSFHMLFIEMHQLLVEILPTKIESCKSRLVGYRQCFIGDDVNNLFMHLTIKILPGRSIETKNKVGEAALKLLNQQLTDYGLENVAISVELVELAQSYYKNCR